MVRRMLGVATLPSQSKREGARGIILPVHSHFLIWPFFSGGVGWGWLYINTWFVV